MTLTEGPGAPGRPLSPGRPRAPWKKQMKEEMWEEWHHFEELFMDFKSHVESLTMAPGVPFSPGAPASPCNQRGDTINTEPTLYRYICKVKLACMFTDQIWYLHRWEITRGYKWNKRLTLGPAMPASPLAPSRPGKPCKRQQKTLHY